MSDQAPVTPSAAPSTPSTPVDSTPQGNSANSGAGIPPRTPAAPAPEFFEVKVNGKVQKMTREEVLSHASMAHAAQSKFEEASRLRKDNEKFEESLKKSKIQALIDKGYTKDQIRQEFEQWYTQEFIDPETLTPQERKLKQAEAELKQFREEKAQAQKLKEEEEQAQLTGKQREYLQGAIIEAMDKSGLPKTKFFAQRMAFYMRQNLLNGWEAPIEVVVSQVKKEYKEGMGNISQDSTAEQLIEILGEGVINKIRKHDLEQLRKTRQNPIIGGKATSSSPTEGPISYSEVNKRLREMREGKR